MRDKRPKTSRMRGGARPASDSNAEDDSLQSRAPDYEVGYGRPPVHKRFKPGESGNPKGRTPKSRNLKTTLKQVLEERIDIRLGGQQRRMTRMEAIVRVNVQGAMKGDMKALTVLSGLIRLVGYDVEASVAGKDVADAVDHKAIIAEYMGRHGGSAPGEGG